MMFSLSYTGLVQPEESSDSQFIITGNEYAYPEYPPPPPVPAPKPPTYKSEIRPRPQLASERIDVGSASIEPVSPYGDSLSAPIGFVDNLDTNTDGYVRIVATPPEKINIVGSEAGGRLTLGTNIDDNGFFKPPRAQYSEKYLAGYEQLDFPNQAGPFPSHINPDFIDPDDYHQDRPSFQASKLFGGKEYYPLGKAPTPPKVTPDVLAQGQDQRFSFKTEKAEKKKQDSRGSFLDFLNPFFVRSNNKADPEGPRPARPTIAKPGSSGPISLPELRAPPRNAPPAPKVPDFKDLPHLQLKTPNRPPGTFPAPYELGGRLNPILIRVPEGSNTPVVPQPQSALKKIGLSKVEAEPNLVEEEFLDVPTKPSIVNLPPSPPLLRRPRPPGDASLQMTSQPASGLPFQGPVRRPKPVRNPLLNLPGIPTPQQRYPHPDFAVHESKIDLKQYKEKLRDPEFHQNLTKAHVYHASDLHEEVSEVNREDISVPSLTQALLSFLQDANPFNFRSKVNEKQVTTIEPRILERDPMVDESILEVTESRLEDLAPAAKPSKIDKLDDIEVVYRPVATTKKQTTTTTTTTTTEATTTQNPIADHVSLLLQQYFSTQSPDQKSNGVPMITYDDENQSVVMEYLSPSGDEGQVEPEGSHRQVDIPNFFPEPSENPDAILNTMTSLDRVFEPSAKTNEAEWFVLDEHGTRRVRLEDETFDYPTSSNTEEEEEVGIEVDEDVTTTERITIGDFEPILAN